MRRGGLGRLTAPVAWPCIRLRCRSLLEVWPSAVSLLERPKPSSASFHVRRLGPPSPSWSLRREGAGRPRHPVEATRGACLPRPW